MPKRFGRVTPEQNPPIHHPSWGEGEAIQLRPVYTWLMHMRAQEAALGLSLLEFEDLSLEERTDYRREHFDPAALNRSVILDMTQSHTFTDDDGTPLAMTDLIDQFTWVEIGFIMAEINKRNGAFRIPETDLGDFRSASEGSGAGEVSGSGASVDAAPPGGSAGDTNNGLDTGRRAQSAKRALAAVSGGVEPPGGG